MVNLKNVAFKVDKQAPTRWPPTQPYSTVINCRKPGGKRAAKPPDELKSQQIPLTKVDGFSKDELKRERSVDDAAEGQSPSKKALVSGDDSLMRASDRPSQINLKPTRLRRGKPLSKHIDLDCWFTILCFSDPAQLLEMRTSIASFYRFLRDNPNLWKLSRNYYYGDDLPNPPAELTEFQFADLRHGHGCMSCGTSATRKTYWAFLRRWCKTCLQSKTIREHDAMSLFKGANGEDISFIQKCIPSGLVDSWGNFVGVGPAHNHSLKTVYLLSDVQKLVAEYISESRENLGSWHAEMRTWINNKAKPIEERRLFARKMEQWEDSIRSTKSYNYQEKKDARKRFFIEKASKLTPPIAPRLMEMCPSFRRAIVIPKDPSMNSWLQLKPKLEKEALALASGFLSREMLEGSPMPTTGMSTPSSATGSDVQRESMATLRELPHIGPQQQQPTNPIPDFTGLPREPLFSNTQPQQPPNFTPDLTGLPHELLTLPPINT